MLEGDAPRLLDEWQLSPELWNLVRRAVDAFTQQGRFILTGSAVPADGVTRHTGAGRFLRRRQRTMSWWEKLELGLTSVSLSAPLEPESRTMTSSHEIRTVTNSQDGRTMTSSHEVAEGGSSR